LRNNSDKVLDFTLVYNKYKNSIYHYVIKMVNDSMLCEDIVQTVFVKFFENMNNIVSKESYNFWLFKTARNEVYTYYRKKKKLMHGDDPHDEEINPLISEDAVGENFEKQEFKLILDNELNALPEEQKEVFVLKEFSDFSYKEIASMMSISEELVKSRLYKVRQKLIKKMAGYVL